MVTRWNDITTWQKAIISLFFALLLWILSFILSHRIIYRWWNTYNGKQYNSIFSMTTFLMFSSNILMYYLSRLFTGSKMNEINRSQVIYIMNHLLVFLKPPGSLTSKDGFLLPRHLCDNILFAMGEDPDFDKYVIDNKLDPVMSLNYDGSGNVINKGVYPSYNDKNSWKYKFRDWGSGEWKVPPDGSSTLLLPYGGERSKAKDYLSTWNNSSKHPDNIFARYGIQPDSYLLISFVNNMYNDQGMKLDAEALSTMMGGHSYGVPGGWLGFLTGLNSSSDDYANIIYTEYDPIKSGGVGSQGGTSNKCNIAGSVTAGIGFGALALMIPGPGWVVGALAMVGSVAGYALDRANKNCKAFEK